MLPLPTDKIRCCAFVVSRGRSHCGLQHAVRIYSLFCGYSSFVIAGERKGVKQSSYLGVAYMNLSTSGLLNGIIFCSVVIFSGLLRRLRSSQWWGDLIRCCVSLRRVALCSSQWWGT
jgi:hypothetical protein